MKIVVSIKTATGAAVNREDAFQHAGRVGAAVLGLADGHAMEAALRLIEKLGHGEVVVVALAAAETLGAVREALALGAARAVMLCDTALEQTDVIGVSRAMAALLKREPADLYLYSSWSGDIDGTLLWVAAAERLGLPVMTQARSLELSNDEITVQRQDESGDVTLSSRLPCMIEVTETINKPRYPTLKGRQAARHKPVKILRLADVGLAPGSVSGGTRAVHLKAPPARPDPVVVDDPIGAPEKIISFLEARNLI